MLIFLKVARNLWFISVPKLPCNDLHAQTIYQCIVITAAVASWEDRVEEIFGKPGNSGSD
jgi:hypothetical protein